jgi:hypothetical protein
MNQKETADMLRNHAAALEAQAKKIREEAEEISPTHQDGSGETKPSGPYIIPPKTPRKKGDDRFI